MKIFTCGADKRRYAKNREFLAKNQFFAIENEIIFRFREKTASPPPATSRDECLLAGFLP